MHRLYGQAEIQAACQFGGKDGDGSRWDTFKFDAGCRIPDWAHPRRRPGTQAEKFEYSNNVLEKECKLKIISISFKGSPDFL